VKPSQVGHDHIIAVVAVDAVVVFRSDGNVANNSSSVSYVMNMT